MPQYTTMALARDLTTVCTQLEVYEGEKMRLRQIDFHIDEQYLYMKHTMYQR